MMLQLLHYNASIKFFIISATIAEDEPSYRTFFRPFNDNRSAPFDYNVVNLHDRINVDRRWHISSPGKNTRFTITDKYLDELALFAANDTKDYNEADRMGISCVVHICRTITSKDILFFTNSAADL